MDVDLQNETNDLIRSWAQYDSEFLAQYLVRDVQDPRINIQSILTRHFLIDKLFGDAPAYLMEQEIRFSLVVNWLIDLIKNGTSHRRLTELLDDLFDDESDSEEIPAYVRETFEMLSVPNYICSLLSARPLEDDERLLEEYLLNTFQNIWNEELAMRSAKKISVIEPACGSANDWRFIDGFGVSKFIDYTGFDLCQTNVDNARAMFPDIDFRVANVFQIDCTDKSFDYCCLHDLLEHLSLKSMETAIAEICRVTEKQLCVHFFNMSDTDEHVVEKTGAYHWNTLSCEKTKQAFLKHASSVQTLNIDRFLTENYNFPDTPNKNAYTFYVSI